jgi:hypothetical protein
VADVGVIRGCVVSRRPLPITRAEKDGFGVVVVRLFGLPGRNDLRSVTASPPHEGWGRARQRTI